MLSEFGRVLKENIHNCLKTIKTLHISTKLNFCRYLNQNNLLEQAEYRSRKKFQLILLNQALEIRENTKLFKNS